MTLPLVPTLALAAAVLSAAATILIRQGLRGSDPYTGFWINCMVGVAGLWLCVLFTGGLGDISMRGVLLFAAAGLIGTVGGRLTRFLAIGKVGASVSAMSSLPRSCHISVQSGLIRNTTSEVAVTSAR